MLEFESCKLTDHEIAGILIRHVGRERLIAICADLGGAIPPSPTHSRTIKRRRDNASPESLLRTTEWCNKTFKNDITGSDTQRKIVRQMSDSQQTEISLDVFSLTFFDAITPEDSDQANLERMIEYDEMRNLGYSDWLKTQLKGKNSHD